MYCKHCNKSHKDKRLILECKRKLQKERLALAQSSIQPVKVENPIQSQNPTQFSNLTLLREIKIEQCSIIPQCSIIAQNSIALQQEPQNKKNRLPPRKVKKAKRTRISRKKRVIVADSQEGVLKQEQIPKQTPKLKKIKKKSEQTFSLVLRNRQVEKRQFNQFRMVIDQKEDQIKPGALVALLNEYRGLFQSLCMEKRMPQKTPLKIRRLMKSIQNFAKRKQFVDRRRAIFRGQIIPEQNENWQFMPPQLFEGSDNVYSLQETQQRLQKAIKDNEASIIFETKKKMQHLGDISEEIRNIMDRTPHIFKEWKLQQSFAWSKTPSIQFSRMSALCLQANSEVAFSLAQLHMNFDQWARYRENIIFLEEDLALFYERKYKSMLMHRQKVTALLNFGPSSIQKFYTHLAKFMKLSPLKSHQSLMKAYQLFIYPEKMVQDEIIPQRVKDFIIRVMQTLISNFVVHPREKIIAPPTDSLGFESKRYFQAYVRLYYYLLARLPMRPSQQMLRPKEWCINRPQHNYRQPYSSQKYMFSDINQLIILIGGLYAEINGTTEQLSAQETLNIFPLDKTIIIYQASAFQISHNSEYYYLGFTGSNFQTDLFTLQSCLLDVEGNLINFKIGKMYYLLPK